VTGQTHITEPTGVALLKEIGELLQLALRQSLLDQMRNTGNPELENSLLHSLEIERQCECHHIRPQFHAISDDSSVPTCASRSS
jgi:hypothetical protein